MNFRKRSRKGIGFRNANLTYYWMDESLQLNVCSGDPSRTKPKTFFNERHRGHRRLRRTKGAKVAPKYTKWHYNSENVQIKEYKLIILYTIL